MLMITTFLTIFLGKDPVILTEIKPGNYDATK